MDRSEWVLVPRNPVTALPILHALADAAGLERLPDPNEDGSYPITGQQSTVRQWYAAMLAAAPPPPAEQASGEIQRWRATGDYAYPAEEDADGEFVAYDDHVAALSQRPVVEIPLNDDTKSILGRMCFQCIHHAKALRLLGRDIPARAEDEQAAVLHWMLNLYLKHGEAWMDAGNAELEQARALAPQQPEKGEGA